MATDWYPRLRGTSLQFFSALFGATRTQWKNNAGAWEARNDADAAFIITRGLTPVAANDYTTKAYVDGLTASATFTSTTTFTWTLPTQYVRWTAWGGGGGGGAGGTGTLGTLNAASGGGGGGGSLSMTTLIQMVSGHQYTVTIGAGGATSTGTGRQGADTTVHDDTAGVFVVRAAGASGGAVSGAVLSTQDLTPGGGSVYDTHNFFQARTFQPPGVTLSPAATSSNSIGYPYVGPGTGGMGDNIIGGASTNGMNNVGGQGGAFGNFGVSSVAGRFGGGSGGGGGAGPGGDGAVGGNGGNGNDLGAGGAGTNGANAATGNTGAGGGGGGGGGNGTSGGAKGNGGAGDSGFAAYGVL